MTSQSKTNWSVIGMLVAWVVSFGSLVWNAAVKDANYSSRLERIEKDLVDLDERMDIAESFRMEIRADLAEIKTDLLWIRRNMELNP